MMDYHRFLSSRGQSQRNHLHLKIKNLETQGSPLSYNLSYGLPNPVTFPFLKASVSLKDGTKFDIDPEVMKTTLQYNKASGYPPLVKHLKRLIQHIHDPPNWSEKDLLVTNGSLEGLSKIFQMLINEGDVIVVPGPCYHGVFVSSRHLQPNYVTVETDDEGLIPERLRKAVVTCKDSGVIPKVLYINPGGNNPMGSVISESRRRLIYDLACQHHLLIIEDDPYYYCQFNEEVPSSFLQMDTEGRVLRLESFSKTVSAGMRTGYVIGPTPLIKTLSEMMDISVMHASLLPQVMLSRLFDTIGLEGFLQMANKSRDLYRNLRDVMLDAAERNLKGLCEWSVTSGGFFLWLKVPKLRDTRNLLLDCGRNKGVLFVPGYCFYADSNAPSQHIRAAYSNTSKEEVDKGFQILAEAIREIIGRAQMIKNKEEE